MEDANSIIIDAAARFAERQRAAEEQAKFLELSEELRMVGDCIAEQPAKFFDFLRACSANVADELQNDFGQHMKARLVLESDQGQDERIASGVYYRGADEQGENDPHLLISDRDVATMGKLLEPVLVRYGEDIPLDTKITLATAAVCWFGLGSWAFDRLDPRRNGEIDESPDSYAFWAETVGLSSEDDAQDSPEVRQLISRHAEILKLRIAGSCIYFGIEDAGIATETELKTFQKLYFSPLFAKQVEARPDTVQPEHFALANPFTHEQVKELFVRLGLVQ